MLIGLGIASVLLLTAATGWFVLQEFAYVSVDRGRLRERADTGDVAAGRALRLTGRLSFVLSGAQLGITVTALLVGYASEPLLGEGLAHALDVTGMSYAARLSLALLVTLVFSTLVQMVLGELAPKNWAIAQPERLALGLARSTTAYLWVAGPLIRLFDGLSNRMLHAVGIEPVEELPQGATPEELERIIDESHRTGLVDQRLNDLLQQTLRFREQTVEHVMTPRVDVQVVGAGDPASRVVELLDGGRSRFPVVGEDIDDVVGVVGLHELLTVPACERETTPVSEVATPPVVLPATLPLPDALERLRSARRQLAVVIDEYGGFAGIVTFEDLAEQVVGPILDEDDPAEPGPERLPGGHGWLVPGRFRLADLAALTGWSLPGTSDYSTVGGLVLDRIGRTARVGDEVRVGAHGDGGYEADPVEVRLEVRAVRRHVPDQVAVGPARGEPGTGGDGSAYREGAR